VKPSEILQRLLDACVEKAAVQRRHVAVARVIGQYDLNNTYQYIIAREDQHLSWLADAVRDLGGTVPAGQHPETPPPVKGEAAVTSLVQADAAALEAVEASWRPRVAEISHARHRLMLELMLGEMLEQARLLRQAAAGVIDLLGRRTGGARTPGSVLGTRWVE
jgi:hypothetical protein